MQVVEYLKQMSGEKPFVLNNIKWEYCWCKYPSGKKDIGVYRFDHDICYDYNDFRAAFNLDKDRPQAPLQAKKVSEEGVITAAVALVVPGVRKKMAKGINKVVDKMKNFNQTKTQTEGVNTKQTITNAATKHVVNGLANKEDEAKATMAKDTSMPKSGGQVIKNAATKDVKGSIPATKKTEAPKPVTKAPADSTVKKSSAATEHIIKKKLTEDEVIKNAATQHVITSIKTGEGYKENMEPAPKVSNPGEEKMATPTKAAPATKAEAMPGATKATEKAPGEEKMATATKAAPATKAEAMPGVKKAPEKAPGEEKVGSKTGATSSEVGGKKSGLPNMGTEKKETAPKETESEPKEEKEKKDESFMKTRAGKDGKVFEGTEVEEETIAEVEDECWVKEGEVPENGENPEDQPSSIHEDETDEETNQDEVQENTKLNEQLNRMKAMFKY